MSNDGNFRYMPQDDVYAEELSHNHRVALFAVEIDGLSYSDAAIVLQIPIGTVKSRVHRARAHIVALRAAVVSGG